MGTNFRALTAARLRAERERLKLKQAEMAALGGVPTRTYQDWEREVSTVSVEYLVEASAHGLDMLFVLKGVRGLETVGALTVEEEKLVENYRAASPDARASLRQVGAALAQQVPDGKTGS